MAVFSVVAEGFLDVLVCRRLLGEMRHDVGPEYQTGGKSQLDLKIRGFNNAAIYSNWFVLRDLDQDRGCPVELCQTILPQRSHGMVLRIAVREVESWLLADRDEIAKFLAVSKAHIPYIPDALNDPKQTLVNAARRSRRRIVREGIPPTTNGGRSEGPGYSALLSEFIVREWDPNRAAENSNSLNRALRCLSNYTPI